MQNTKPIPGYPGYHIDENGNVFNSRNMQMAQHQTSVGYRRISLTNEKGKRVGAEVHRLVYQAWKGEIPKGYWINHLDGVKNNNHISNLEAGTPSSNHIHARDELKRVYARGEDTRVNKLTQEGVEAVKELHKNGWSQNRIARAFQVSQPCISYIVRDLTWVKGGFGKNSVKFEKD